MRIGTLAGIISIASIGTGLALAGPGSPGHADPVEIARAHLDRNAPALGLSPDDIRDLIVTDRLLSPRTGVTHVHLRQRVAGLEVANAVINVNVAADGTVLGVGNRLVRNAASRLSPRRPLIGMPEAIERAAAPLGLALTEPLVEIGTPFSPDRPSIFKGAGVSIDAIPVKLVLYAVGDGSLRPAYDMVIRTPDLQHWYNLWVDAENGEILETSDWIDHDSYNVYALPLASPTDGPRTIQVDPAYSGASPFGWHDTNGIAGPEFTDTRGNNVEAATDLNADNVVGAGEIRPTGGGSLVFNYALDLNLGPAAYRQAAVVNLFYWNNIIHDLLHSYGFDEQSGNFQASNYGNPGLAGDPVQADAQDGVDINNANFATPPDGFDPRMQMFVWTPNLTEVVVDAPSPAAGVYAGLGAQFGPALGVDSGPIILADDNVGTESDGCEVFPQDVFLGAIALIDRGNCTFVTKVRNAENSGAIAVIVANNAGDDLVIMLDDGTGSEIITPSIFIAQSDGQTIRAGLPATGTVWENPSPPPDRDSDLDAGVIAHEYCHGLSNRLTGGPSNVNCLQGAQQAGEGWSDICTLVFTADPDDTATTPRGVGTYLLYQPQTGKGIRPYPYTTDMAVNPLTYGDLATGTLAIPHGIGSVWAMAFWEIYWNLVDKHGYDPDLYGGTGGNNLAFQLVVDGLKLQPCNPTFVDARDAILLADQNLTGGANQCEIWEGFAKRGLGVNAADGGSSSSLAVVEDFTVPPACLSAAPGEPSDLVVESIDLVTGVLTLSYQPACNAADHNIVYGPLEDVSTYGYSGQDCGIGTSGSYNQFNPGAESYFFIVVGTDGAGMEGSYGRSSDLIERPEDPNDPVCAFSQSLASTCGP